MTRVPAPMDTGTTSALGWINLTTLLLRRFASFGRAALPRFGDPKGDILRISSAVGFIFAGGAVGVRGTALRRKRLGGGQWRSGWNQRQGRYEHAPGEGKRTRPARTRGLRVARERRILS